MRRFDAKYERFARRLLAALLTVASMAGAHAAKPDAVAETVAPFFRPYQSEVAALAPDGRYLAYDSHQRAEASIILLDLTDLSSRRFVLTDGSRRSDRIVQMTWMSPTRLAFVLRSRAVGSIEVEKGEVKALLTAKDLRQFQPGTQIGARRQMRSPTPDMPADGSRGNFSNILSPRVQVDSAPVDSLVYGDLFNDDTDHSISRTLVPFLMGARQADAAKLLVEVRMNRDPLDDYTDEIRKLTLPGNVIVTNFGVPQPEDAPVDTSTYGEQTLTRPLPPDVLLEIDAKSGRRRVALSRSNWLRMLTDQEGRPRLALDASRVRRRYLYRDAQSKQWTPLERVVKDDIAHGFTLSPQAMLGPRSVPLGFDFDGTTLYYASNVVHDTFALRSLDMSTGRSTDAEIAIERADLVEPADLIRDDVLVFDPHLRRLAGVRFTSAMRATFWLDGELAQIQAAISKELAPRQCEILEWDAERNRFLVDVSGPGEPGGFHIFDRARNKFFACAARAPWLTEKILNDAHPIAFAASDGRKLSGFITLPRRPRVDPPPVLVYFHDGPWFCDRPVFNRGAQALAGLGFAVLQINYRGSGGFGRAHLTAIQGGWDQIVMEDMKAALEWSADNYRVNARMVAAFGNGFGGYLAVRAAQLDPESVRCAVAINAPSDLAAWSEAHAEGQRFRTGVRRKFFGEDRAALKAGSALAAAASTTRPVLVVHAAENAYVPVSMGRALYHALKKQDPACAYLELSDEGHGGWSDASTERLFAELGRFFNATIYNYSVEVGPATAEPTD